MQKRCLLGQAVLAVMVLTTCGFSVAHAQSNCESKRAAEEKRHRAVTSQLSEERRKVEDEYKHTTETQCRTDRQCINAAGEERKKKRAKINTKKTSARFWNNQKS